MPQMNYSAYFIIKVWNTLQELISSRSLRYTACSCHKQLLNCQLVTSFTRNIDSSSSRNGVVFRSSTISTTGKHLYNPYYDAQQMVPFSLFPPPAASSSSSSCYDVGSQNSSYRAYVLYIFKLYPPLQCLSVSYSTIIRCHFTIHSIQITNPNFQCLLILFFIVPLF